MPGSVMTSRALFCNPTVKQNALAADLFAGQMTQTTSDFLMGPRKRKCRVLFMVEDGRPPVESGVTLCAVGIPSCPAKLSGMDILVAARASLGGFLEHDKSRAVILR